MSLPALPSEEVAIRKVLIEKYTRNWMPEWLALQKNIVVRNQNYEEAAKWRNLENTFYRIEYNKDKHYLRTEFDDVFFHLYERLK